MSDTDRLTFEQASKELGISEQELEKLVADGRIASIKDGDTLFFKRDAIESYKSQETEPAVLLSDEEINLLEDDEEVDFGIDLEGGESAAPAAAAASAEGETDEIKLDEGLPDIDLGAGDEKVTDPDETVVSGGGVLEDEGTTPLEGDDSGLLEDTASGGLGEDTLLDTDVLELGDDSGTDTFDLDTAEETLMDPTEEGTLLRGGGARVMQMKRKRSHAAWTVVLAAAGLFLLLPLSVLLSTIYLEGMEGEAAAASKQSFEWIGKYGGSFEGFVKSLAKLFQ